MHRLVLLDLMAYPADGQLSIPRCLLDLLMELHLLTVMDLVYHLLTLELLLLLLEGNGGTTGQLLHLRRPSRTLRKRGPGCHLILPRRPWGG